MFANICVHEKVNIFKKILMTVVSNYISNKTVGFDYKDPPWINKSVKNKV